MQAPPVAPSDAVRFNDITKSQNDKRLYRGLVLPNKMKVLLISDSTTDKSAASLDVNIGKSDQLFLSNLVRLLIHLHCLRSFQGT